MTKYRRINRDGWEVTTMMYQFYSYIAAEDHDYYRSLLLLISLQYKVDFLCLRKRPLSEVRGFIERRKRCGHVFKVSCYRSFILASSDALLTHEYETSLWRCGVYHASTLVSRSLRFCLDTRGLAWSEKSAPLRRQKNSPFLLLDY